MNAKILLHQYLSSQELVSGSKEVDIERLNIALNRIGKQIEESDKVLAISKRTQEYLCKDISSKKTVIKN